VCANGQRLKCLTVVDEYTRECLAIDVAASIRSERVVAVLARLVAARGAPTFLRSDNGPEFVADVVQRWLEEEGISTAYIAQASRGRTAATRASTASGRASRDLTHPPVEI
jgi:putative transposase